MSFLETSDTGDLMLAMNNLLSDYNKKRELFHSMSNQYFRQNPHSDRILESDLTDILSDCASLKQQYTKIKQELKKRQESEKKPAGRFGDFEFTNGLHLDPRFYQEV